MNSLVEILGKVTPYGPHWNEEKSIPECLIGGTMCDICWDAQRLEFKNQIEVLVLDVLHKNKVRVKPIIEAFPEIKDIDGVESVYELTLTTTKDDPYELLQYLRKIRDSKMFGILAYKACLELQKNGHPHVHVMVWSNKKVLNSNHIKSRIKFPYIFTLKFVRKQLNFYNYILKEKDDPITIEYCRIKGIQQIWSEEVSKSAAEGRDIPEADILLPPNVNK